MPDRAHYICRACDAAVHVGPDGRESVSVRLDGTRREFDLVGGERIVFPLPGIDDDCPAARLPGHPVSVPTRSPVGMPAAPVGMPSHPVERPGHPVDLPAAPLTLPESPVDLPSHPAPLPGHAVTRSGRPAALPGQAVGLPGHAVGLPGHPTGLFPVRRGEPVAGGGVPRVVAARTYAPAAR
jgi:hypothetical protein